jgi:hypothetical protein
VTLRVATGGSVSGTDLRTGDAYRLPFPDASLAGYRADTVFHARGAGFHNATVEVHTAVFTDATMLVIPLGITHAAQDAGAITAEQAHEWTTEQTHRARNGTLFLAIPIFAPMAHRP